MCSLAEEHGHAAEDAAGISREDVDAVDRLDAVELDDKIGSQAEGERPIPATASLGDSGGRSRAAATGVAAAGEGAGVGIEAPESILP